MNRIDRIKLDMRESHEILAFYKKLQPFLDINVALDTDGEDEPSNYHTSARLETLNFVYYNFVQELTKIANAIPEENYCYCKECNPIVGTPVAGAEYELNYHDLFKQLIEEYKIPPRECKNCMMENDTDFYTLCEDHKDYFKPLDIEQ